MLDGKQLTPEWTIAALLEKILTLMEIEEKRKLLQLRYPRGTTFTSILHLKRNDPVTRIDFLDAQRHRNIPFGEHETGGKDIVTILEVPVSRLVIFNLGPGGCYFDTNRPYNDDTANTPIHPSSSWEIPTADPSIFAINITADEESGDAKVRLTAIV